MRASKQATGAISPLEAFVFAAALSIALLIVLAPMLPGEAPLHAGDASFKTFRIGSELVAGEGEGVAQGGGAGLRGGGGGVDGGGGRRFAAGSVSVSFPAGRSRLPPPPLPGGAACGPLG